MIRFFKNNRNFFSVLNPNSFHQEPLDQTNTSHRQAIFEKYINYKAIPLEGCATQEEILKFQQNILIIYGLINHLKYLVFLWDLIEDHPHKRLIQRQVQKMFNSLLDGLLSGAVNMLDTAINFRYQKSERVFKAILNYLVKEKFFQRSEIIIGSKGGFIHEDADKGIGYDQIVRELVQNQIIDDPNKDIFEMNCIQPKFIEHQFEKSRENIGVNQLDFYSINQPEMHLSYLDKDQFFDKLLKSFEVLERKVQDGKLQVYGISTWSCFRVNKTSRYHIDLNELDNKVKQKLGTNNSFKLIYTPLNILMPETYLERYQQEPQSKQDISFLQLSTLLKYNVFGISAFANGLATTIPLSTQYTKMSYQGAKHLNYLRSLPYDSLKTIVFSSLNNRHNKTNLSVARGEYIGPEELESYLKDSLVRKQKPEIECDLRNYVIQLNFLYDCNFNNGLELK